MVEQYGLFFVLALVAEIIGTISGFGSSILFVPIAAVFFDFKIVLGITAVFHVFSNVSKIVLFRRGIDATVAWRLGLPAVAAVVVGALLTAYIPQQSIELAMAVLLVVLSLFLIRNQDFKLNKSHKNLYLGGALSGFLAGLIGTGGAIRGLTLIAFNLEKDIFIATSALIDLGVDSSRAAVYIYNGYFQWAHVQLIPILVAISILGSWLGKIALKYTSQQAFRYLVLGLIVLTSAFQVLKISGLWPTR